jgi:hypothetical protein
MSVPNQVEFHLFGGLRAFRNGQPVELLSNAADTCLRLLLLSGNRSLRCQDKDKWSVESLLSKANRLSSTNGGQNFKANTGLTIAIRRKVILRLEGLYWSDIEDFERVWRMRDRCTAAELQGALAISEPGIQLNSWPPTALLDEWATWARNRIDELTQHRVDIATELDRRVGPREELAPQHGPLDAIAEEAEPKDGARPDYDGVRLRGEPQAGTEPEAQQWIESSRSVGPVGRAQYHPNPLAKKAVIFAAIGILSAAGYIVANSASAGRASRLGGSASVLENSGNPASPRNESGGSVEAPGQSKPAKNPVSLYRLYSEDVTGLGTVETKEDVLIGRKLFTGYLYSWEPGNNTTTGLYKLGGQYATLTCYVGVPDSNKSQFEAVDRYVLFEGDGKVLKKVEVKPGAAIEVRLDVSRINALMVTWNHPVVIVAPTVMP